ncbi:MAG: hypothetical protein IJU35_04970 [Paludibacteraceae bacterium]|nr:hypothetical protein [Paludibacteraceae bacterium]
MKAIKFLAILVFISCSVQVMFAQTSYDIDWDALNQVADGTNKLNNNAYEKPCALYDDDQWYTAFNEKIGVEGDPQLANSLLRTCQEQLKDKLAGKVQAITTTYFDQMDIDGKSKAAEHIEGASQMVVEQIINETREYCRRERPSIYEKGKIILYMSIRVKKQELVQEIVDGIQNDAEAKVRFNEKKFRDAAFKVFEEDKSQQ